jgi:hypothetical protein
MGLGLPASCGGNVQTDADNAQFGWYAADTDGLRKVAFVALIVTVLAPIRDAANATLAAHNALMDETVAANPMQNPDND